MSKQKNDECGTSCGCAPTYWQDVENKVVSKAQLQEFPEGEFDSFTVQKTRRNFLKIMGFSVSALPLTSCIKIPVRKALPYVNKQDNIIPGVANWYASTFEGLPVLVKTREGRPIKIEGNEKSSYARGGASARAQASVLSVYDSNRLRDPMVEGKKVSWAQFDQALAQLLKEASGDKVLVTPSLRSPSELALINELKSKLGIKHIAFDAVSSAGEAKANQVTHGVYTLAEYDFEQADVVASFGADFLGAHRDSVSNAKSFSARRNPQHTAGMNKHIHVESMMSLTGSNADHRYTRSERDQRDILLALVSKFGGYDHAASKDNQKVVDQLYRELMDAKGKSIVLSGSSDADVQVLVNFLNHKLNNFGSTVFVGEKAHEALADDAAFEQLVSKMEQGSIGAVFFAGVDPLYAYAKPERLKKALAQVRLKVAMAQSESATTKEASFVAPTNHVYESWSDTMVSSKELSITQPVIQPLFGSRMWTETMMVAAGMDANFYEYMKSFWSNKIKWNQALHDGVVELSQSFASTSVKAVDVKAAANKVKNTKEGSGIQIKTFASYAMGDGSMANNPWLQEMPDPITKATYDNHALVSPGLAKEKGISSGDVVKLASGDYSVTLPAVVQPGMAKNTVAVALGYGQKIGGRVSKNLGVNAFGFVTFSGSTFNYSGSFGKIEKTGQTTKLARTQTYQYLGDREKGSAERDLVRETTFSAYKNNPKAGNERVFKLANVDIYPEHKKTGHQWAMAINMSSCTGCSACIISCNAENNVPAVGKTEIARKRDMHWLRLDRYYKGDDNEPEVVHQPMLCQHCENAPCENVCPVLATVHSADGLNQQIYNRCVGTRYCANNCPYKVRRFNWFNYDHSDDMERMVLNPDVSVRSRGIMEKCSMCIQRIQEGKLKAKRERRQLADGDIKTACQQSCPSNAIVFGDMMNPESEISKQLADERKYVVLEELNVQPRVNYLTKIRNK